MKDISIKTIRRRREKNPQRYSVYNPSAENGENLSPEMQIDPVTAFEKGIYDFDNVDEETLADAIKASRQRRACDKAIEILGYREHSAFELKRKLLRFVPEEDADSAVEKMKEYGYIDDNAYALKLATELSRLKLYGVMKIHAELQARGISREIINETLEQLPDQVEQIARFMESKELEISNQKNERDRLVRKLMTRGYKWEDISVYFDSNGAG